MSPNDRKLNQWQKLAKKNEILFFCKRNLFLNTLTVLDKGSGELGTVFYFC